MLGWWWVDAFFVTFRRNKVSPSVPLLLSLLEVLNYFVTRILYCVVFATFRRNEVPPRVLPLSRDQSLVPQVSGHNII